MIKVVLYSENNDNIKKISGFLDKRNDFNLVTKKYKNQYEDTFDPSNIDLVLFDLSGLLLNKADINADIKRINGNFESSSAGRILILEPGQQDCLFDDFLFANDYLFIKNLEEELVPRINFLLYKMKLVVPADSLVVGDMVLNFEKYELVVNKKVIVLTYKEFEMLKLLMQNRDKVFTRINLLSTVWGYDYYGGSRTVDVHMRRLRAKIPPPYNNMLKTIRNVGYMFSPEG